MENEIPTAASTYRRMGLKKLQLCCANRACHHYFDMKPKMHRALRRSFRQCLLSFER